MLKALVYYQRNRHGLNLRGNLPQEPSCQKYIELSGYLDGLVNYRGQPFPRNNEAAHILFEEGHGKLSAAENLNISEILEDAVAFLGGDIRHELKLKTLVLEGCANSIEWSVEGEVGSGQWMLGMKKELSALSEPEVIFTVTDAGRGIMTSLRRKISDTVLGYVKMQTEHQVLQETFSRKWGSNTQEPNRNNGLPTIKKALDLGVIEDLKVITNNVMLQYSSDTVTAETFPRGHPRYAGTFIQWKVTRGCLPKMERIVDYGND